MLFKLCSDEIEFGLVDMNVSPAIVAMVIILRQSSILFASLIVFLCVFQGYDDADTDMRDACDPGPISIEGIMFRSNAMIAQGVGDSNIISNFFQRQGVAGLCCRRGLGWLVQDPTGVVEEAARSRGLFRNAPCARGPGSTRSWANQQAALTRRPEFIYAVIVSEKLLSKSHCSARRNRYWRVPFVCCFCCALMKSGLVWLI